MTIRRAFLMMAAVWLAGCSGQDRVVNIIVSNPTRMVRTDEGVAISLGKLPAFARRGDFKLLDDAGREVPFQLDDLDGDGTPDELFFQVSLGALETTAFHCVSRRGEGKIQKRVDARLIRQDQPGLSGAIWESEWLAYASFGPQALYVYGKSTPGLYGSRILSAGSAVGPEGVLNYLRVGLGMGAGSVFADASSAAGLIDRPFANSAVVEYRLVTAGPLRGIVEMKLKDWKTSQGKIDLRERLEIDGGQRYLKETFQASNWPGKNVLFGVGLAALPGEARTTSFENRFVSTTRGPVILGNGPPEEGFMGAALIYNPRDFVSLVPAAQPDQDHRVYLRTPQDPLTVYLVHAWDRDGRFHSPVEWHGYAAQLAERLNAPLDVFISD